MSGVVCHYGDTRRTLLASARIARLLAARYDFPIVDTPESAAVRAGRAHDYCIVVSSASGFAPPVLREAVGELAARADRFIFVQNDFMTSVAGQVGTWHKRLGKDYTRTVWSTIPSQTRVGRCMPESVYVPWNMLTYDAGVELLQRIDNEVEGMSGVVCHYSKIDPNGLLATARIADFLATRYGFDRVDTHETAAQHAGKTYDYCLIVNSAGGYADEDIRRTIAELAIAAKTYILVQNDYTLAVSTGDVSKTANSQGKTQWVRIWSTVPRQLQNKWAADGSMSINWNQLTYRPKDPAAIPYESPQALFYYGAHRRDRIPYFQRWLDTDAYPVNVSTSTRVYKKWKESTPKAPLVPQMTDAISEMRELGNVGLYIEDAYSHKVYTSPANRFYEMLSARVPMLFDRATLNTFRQAGYDTQQFLPYAPLLDDSNRVALVKHATENAAELADAQQRLWARDYRGELEAKLAVAEAKVGLHPVRI